MAQKKVLLVENDKNEMAALNSIFKQAGHELCMANDGWAAIETATQQQVDLVVADFDLPQMNGIELMRKIKESRADLPVVLVSGGVHVKDAVEAMKMGAHDVIVKPLTLNMIDAMTRQLSNGREKTPPGLNGKRYQIITEHDEMKRLLDEAREVANSRASIFIQGESGTGKELFARYIHHHSGRKLGPFVAINCAALPETLLESELFGHEKGAFTGAITRKIGKFELADQGTMLLDEISEMDYPLQSKLLRVLQEKEIDRVGGAGPVPIDVRVLATTNRDIEQQVKEGRFREDLYYRLNIIPFHLPPLRERLCDIPVLSEYFIDKYNRLENRNVKGLTPQAVDQLLQMPWKGNVRELENVIERAVLICKGDAIEPADLQAGGRRRVVAGSGYPFVPAGSLREMEEKVICHTLDKTNGNRTHAAEILGISVRTLRNKLNEYRQKMEVD